MVSETDARASVFMIYRRHTGVLNHMQCNPDVTYLCIFTPLQAAKKGKPPKSKFFKCCCGFSYCIIVAEKIYIQVLKIRLKNAIHTE